MVWLPAREPEGASATPRQCAYQVEGLPSASSARVLLHNELATQYGHCCRRLTSRRAAGGSPPPQMLWMGEMYDMGRMDSEKYKGFCFSSLQKVPCISFYNHQ